MRLRIQLLRFGKVAIDRLQHDGWRLKTENTDTVSACHPAVQSESAARARLHALGLLTTANLRIDFSLLERGCLRQMH
jgi:hypothetical protein